MTAFAGAPRMGRVVAYDEQRGLGEVETDDHARHPFHCTGIADGSRTVAVGAGVTFEVVRGVLGRYEATRIRPG
jgi:cold shock CspA family protein